MNECSEGEQLIEILEREMATHQQLNDEYRHLVDKVKGNVQWERIVHARWLRKRQLNQDNDFDPRPDDLVPVFVKDGI